MVTYIVHPYANDVDDGINSYFPIDISWLPLLHESNQVPSIVTFPLTAASQSLCYPPPPPLVDIQYWIYIRTLHIHMYVYAT